jgi:uncharacterized protein with NRDE domain
MCLLFFSYKTTPGYKLVLAANRDEFLVRPTEPLAFLDSRKTILAGRDVQGGGTWLGITSGLKLGALTNYRAVADNRLGAPSRGEILMDYFNGKNRAQDCIQSLAVKGARYNGFNVIMGDDEGLYYYSNRGPEPRALEPGFYGLCNHLLDTPWPKVRRGKELLRSAMVASGRIDHHQIFSLLEDSWCPPQEQLPDTGVGQEWEQLLSSMFIDGETYGTRSSAVITIDAEDRVEFTEKSYYRSPSKDRPYAFVVTFQLNADVF